VTTLVSPRPIVKLTTSFSLCKRTMASLLHSINGTFRKEVRPQFVKHNLSHGTVTSSNMFPHRTAFFWVSTQRVMVISYSYSLNNNPEVRRSTYFATEA